MNVIYFYLFLLVHPYLAMWWKSFEQADRKSWEALVPGYNYFVAFKIGAKKPFWSLLLIFPGVHLVMWAVANVSYIRKFGYFSLVDTLQGIFFPYIIMFKIAQSQDKVLPDTNWANSSEVSRREWGDHLVLFLCLPVIGHVIALGIAAVTRAEPGKKTKVKDWGDALLFALVAASIIRTYVFEPFQIPTGSMEKTLLVGDFLFVNKLAYGPKVPVTPVSYPLVHNTIPWINVKSYMGIETSEYTRLPGFSEVNRYDVVVFNYPSGDTSVYDPRMPFGLMGHDYHDILLFEAYLMYQNDQESRNNYNKYQGFYRDSINLVNKKADSMVLSPALADELALNYYDKQYIENIEYWKSKARAYLASGYAHERTSEGIREIETYGLIPRPVDKRENYIKRCVGLPGDFIEIKNSILYVNDKPAEIADRQNLRYEARHYVPDVKFMNDIEVEDKFYQKSPYADTSIDYILDLTEVELKKVKKHHPNSTFTLHLEPQKGDDPNYVPNYTQFVKNVSNYPKDPYVENTTTDFTRFQIPKKGMKIELNANNLAWYKRVITAYENHTLKVEEDGTVLIDGKKATTYTFEMNYYWMMGDNRYNSVDSRVWGFVPEDHIVGKASMVWFSKQPGGRIRWGRMFTIIE